MRGPDGQTIAADEAKISFWTNQGYRPISEGEIGAELAARAARPDDRGFLGDVNAAVTSALSGATLGGSDVLLGGLLDRGQRERLAADIDYAPVASTVARIGGEILPALATGGESLAARGLGATPAGQLARLSARVGEAVPGAGAAARIGRLAATGATEGAISNAGQYLGAMALQDKDLSAESFLASMRDGALYGGGAAGALGVAGEGLVAARRLLPETELNAVAARRARQAATEEVSRAVDDTRELEAAARARARQLREEWAATNQANRAEIDAIAVKKAQDLADAHTAAARAKQAKFEADAAAAQSRAEGAAARAERAKNPPKRTRGKKGEPETPPVTDAPAPVDPPVPAAAAPDVDSAVGKAIGADDDLMRQLGATKEALDSGTPLSELSNRAKETLVEDALNQRVAQESPEMARLLKHLDGLADARSRVASWLDKYPQGKVRSVEYQEGMRKPSGWVETVPAGEGTIGLPRGRQFELRGGDAERAAFEGKVARGDLHRIVDDPLSTAEEKLAAQRALGMSADEQAAALADLQAKRTAKQIVEASDEEMAAAPAAVDKHVEKALEGHADLADDIDDASDAIGALEQKTADLSDELGADAPPVTQERARQYRQAHAGADESAAKATEDMVADAERAAKTISTGDAPRAATGLLSKAEHAGQMLEALQMLGVPVPSASQLPVVGPLLSLYLKAKLAARAVKRLGGTVPRTAETEIARRGADVKSRLIRAADRALEGTARKITSQTAARASGATAASILSAKLFDDRDPATPERQTRKGDSLEEVYLARSDEITRAMKQGAVREAMRRRIRTTDSPLLDAITAAEERKLQFLYDKMPKAAEGPAVLGKRTPRVPARSDIERWSKYVAAAQRPAETLEGMLNGEIVNAEAAETIRAVCPRLLEDVQKRVVERAIETDTETPYRQRVHLSRSLGIPLDESQSPEYAAFLGSLYAPKSPPAPTPRQGGPIDSRAAERIDPETRT